MSKPAMSKFVLPEDLTALSVADLDGLLVQARENATSVLNDTPNDVEALSGAKQAFNAVLGEKSRRDAAELAAELAAVIAEDEEVEAVEDVADAEDEVVEDEAPVVEAVTATAAPAVRRKTSRSTLDTVPETGPEFATMVTAPDVPGMAGGQKLNSFAGAVEAMTARLKAYPKPSNATRRANAGVPSRDIGNGMFSLDVAGRSFVRHGAVVLRREFPEELRLTNGSEEEMSRVTSFASKERRLPGGSLLKSAKEQIKKGKAITAAVGWCAPSETIYNLCDLSSMDGLLDLPEIQASRGGFNVPADGGPDFSVIWDGLGDAGDVILTEYDVENDTEKSCFEIPCPDFVDVRLDVAYACLTGSLLQRRTYPEVVELFTQQSVKALAHKINASVISRIATASGAATVIPADASGDDAASGILSATDLAVEDIKYRERMGRDVTLEVVFPYWALTQIRAAMARRKGIGRLDVTDQMIFDWFEIRSVMPRFVYDWQDAYTGGSGGGRPGGSSPITALPTTVQFLIYPAGTWTKTVQDVVSLDTIYDNAMLTQNQYTATFVEDGFNVIQTCPQSRLYTAQADPSGVVGCCP